MKYVMADEDNDTMKVIRLNKCQLESDTYYAVQ